MLDNKTLQKMNTYLFDIVHDILSVNFDMANDNVINANELNLFKASLIGDSFIQNQNFISSFVGKRPFGLGMNELHQKIIKIVSKRNLNLKNTYIAPSSITGSLVLQDPKAFNNLKINQALANNNNENNIALINKIKSQETEKSASKLQMIRDALIHEIEESEAIKKNVNEFKEYFNDIINLNIKFFNQKILKGDEDLCLITKKKIVKDSVEQLKSNLEDDKTKKSK